MGGRGAKRSRKQVQVMGRVPLARRRCWCRGQKVCHAGMCTHNTHNTHTHLNPKPKKNPVVSSLKIESLTLAAHLLTDLDALC